MPQMPDFAKTVVKWKYLALLEIPLNITKWSIVAFRTTTRLQGDKISISNPM